MEISKMLTVSTAHISEETAEMLETANPNLADDLMNIKYSVYNTEYGWFIYIDPFSLGNRNIPYDLMKCILLARDLDCKWLCLDRDGEVLDYLDTYEW